MQYSHRHNDSGRVVKFGIDCVLSRCIKLAISLAFIFASVILWLRIKRTSCGVVSKGKIMANGKFIAYHRVSTQKQGASGLGLEAQQIAVASYLNGGEWELIDEFKEVETGKDSDALAKRPQLRAALAACRKYGAVLIIAKLDRLARNVHFVSGLMESKVKFVACDMPEANELTLHIMAAFAEHEAKRISQRTRDALAVAKGRGIVLGKAGAANLRSNIQERQSAANAFAEKLRPIFDGMKTRGISQRGMVAELNNIGVPTPKGGKWMLAQAQRVIERLYPPSINNDKPMLM